MPPVKQKGHRMFGQHAAYIIPCYVVSALVILAMIIRIRLQYSAQTREITRLEETGIRRRSDKAGQADNA